MSTLLIYMLLECFIPNIRFTHVKGSWKDDVRDGKGKLSCANGGASLLILILCNDDILMF